MSFAPNDKISRQEREVEIMPSTTKQEKMGHLLHYDIDPDLEQQMKQEKEAQIEESKKNGNH